MRVSGTAAEFQDQTQIGASQVTTCGTGTVAPTDVTLPAPTADFFERYEGMLVRMPQTLSVTEHFQLGRFGQVVMSAGGRLLQPTNVVAPRRRSGRAAGGERPRQIIVDDALQNQNPDPILFGRGGNPLSASNTLRGGDTATGMVGVMTYTWAGNSASGNAFRLRPVGALGGGVPLRGGQPAARGRPAVGGTLRVAGMNLLNFFNTFDGSARVACTRGVGGALTDCRGADNAAEFVRQWPKTVAAVVGTGADVVAVTELENDGYGPDSAIQFLTDRLNEATAPGTYAFVDADAGTGQVERAGHRRDQGRHPLQAGRGDAGRRDGRVEHRRVRERRRHEPAQPAGTRSGVPPERHRRDVVVSVNHLKSKGSACDSPDTGDGQGNCAAVRTQAAQELAAWLGGDPTGTASPNILILGDLNSYAKEDPVTALNGAGFTDLVAAHAGAGPYSYVFDGQWGYLDHALGSAALAASVTGVAEWHINADEPSVLDYNTNFKSPSQLSSLYAPDVFRASDHDPVLVGLGLSPTPGFVTGGGWLGPAGEKTSFGFVARYGKGATAPSGTTEIQLGNGHNFHSTSYEWLVVAGSSARLEGHGTIDGSGNYDFSLWAGDRSPDTFRIRITGAGGALVYDSGAERPLGGGSIVVHD